MKTISIKSFINFIILFSLYFAAAVSINSDSLNRVALYLAIPAAFVLSLLKRKCIIINKFDGLLIALFAWDCFSYLWAQYPTSASRELHRVLGAFLLVYIVAANGQEKSIIKYLYITYFIIYIGAWYYSANNALVVLDQSGDADRLNDDKLNANTMAYYTFYVTFASFVLSDLTQSRKWSKFFRFIFLGMIPLSLFVALVTASRQVLIIQIPLMGYLIYERYINEAKRKTRFLFLLAAAVLLFIFLPIAIDIYEDSYLAVRSEKAIQEDSRWFLLFDAVKVGLKHFPFGVGAGNYINYSFNKHFSHCSYTELFANNGIVGLVLYLWLLVYFIKNQWSYYKRTHDRKFIIFLVFGIIFSFDQLFYVFYTDLWLISFFILVANHSESYYKSLANDNQVYDYNKI